MENTITTTEEKKYYGSYRGYVYLYTPIKASSDEEAREKWDNYGEITPDMELILNCDDFDFEKDECWDIESPNESVNPQNDIPKKLSKAVIETAHYQAEARERRYKEIQIADISNQIEKANQQLLTTTRGITEEIDKLQKQLEELRG